MFHNHLINSFEINTSNLGQSPDFRSLKSLHNIDINYKTRKFLINHDFTNRRIRTKS
jgi:hypothetical protein